MPLPWLHSSCQTTCCSPPGESSALVLRALRGSVGTPPVGDEGAGRRPRSARGGAEEVQWFTLGRTSSGQRQGRAGQGVRQGDRAAQGKAGKGRASDWDERVQHQLRSATLLSAVPISCCSSCPAATNISTTSTDTPTRHAAFPQQLEAFTTFTMQHGPNQDHLPALLHLLPTPVHCSKVNVPST